MNVLIVDGALEYECPYSGEVYDLVIINALYIPSMCHNLVPPLIMRSGSIIVNDVPNIHCENPTVEDHYTFLVNLI